MNFSIKHVFKQTKQPSSYIMAYHLSTITHHKTEKIQIETFSQKKPNFILEPKTSTDYHAKCVVNLRFCAIVVRDEWSLCHVHLGNSDRKRQNDGNKLPEYRYQVSHDLKESDLNGANPLACLHHVTKGSKCKEHGIKAIQITRNNESSIVGDRFWQGPRDYSEYKGHQVVQKGNAIQNVPSIPKTK